MKCQPGSPVASKGISTSPLGARPSNSQQAEVLEFYCRMAHQAGVIQQLCPVGCIILSLSELLGRAPSPITGAATRAASAMAQNRSASSRVPPSASTCRTHIRTVNFMPVINGGGSAEGGSTEVTAGSAPLAARSAIRPLTWSGDIDAGNCNTTVAPAGSAAHPTGVTQSRSSSPKARDRAAIALYLSGFASITRLPGRTGGRSGLFLGAGASYEAGM